MPLPLRVPEISDPAGHRSGPHRGVRVAVDEPQLALGDDPVPQSAGVVPADAEGTDKLIREMESDGKSMPVLLRQYLKLNARALGFSVDPAFGHVLDALMAVDLTRVPPHILRRYFGDGGLASYLAHQSRVGDRAA